MSARPERVDKMSAVQLASRQQVERCGKHAYPGSDGHRMKINICCGKWNARGLMLSQWRQQAKKLGISQLQIRSASQIRLPAREHRSVYESGNRHHKACDRPSDANVEQRAPRGNTRADANECSQSSNESGRRNEVGQTGLNAVTPGSDVVSQLVGQKNQHECRRKGYAQNELRRVAHHAD